MDKDFIDEQILKYTTHFLQFSKAGGLAQAKDVFRTLIGELTVVVPRLSIDIQTEFYKNRAEILRSIDYNDDFLKFDRLINELSEKLDELNSEAHDNTIAAHELVDFYIIISTIGFVLIGYSEASILVKNFE